MRAETAHRFSSVFRPETFQGVSRRHGCIEPEAAEKYFVCFEAEEELLGLFATFDAAAGITPENRVLGRWHKQRVKLSRYTMHDGDIVRSWVFPNQKYPFASDRRVEIALSIIESSEGIFAERHYDSVRPDQNYIFGQEPLTPGELGIFGHADEVVVIMVPFRADRLLTP